MESLTVTPEEAGERLDRLIAKKFPSYSRTYFQSLVNQGFVTINGGISKKRTLVEAGDEVEVTFVARPELSFEPEEIPLEILYEDDFLLAVNKPAGMVVHPAKGHWSGTFVNALLHHCGELPGERPGIVHRLDKDTTGVLLAAKTEEAQQALIEAFAEREVEKEYLAICIGNPGNCRIEAPIGRHPVDRKRFAVVDGGKTALTECEVLGGNGKWSVVKIRLHTGRTHQIRVHMHHRGTPILGDPVYGRGERQMLHAWRIALTHPITGDPLEITAPPPKDLAKIMDSLLESAHGLY